MSRRKSIPKKVERRLWAKSAGRCEYCNRYLLEDSLSKDEMNEGYISHIVAASPNGPRGDKDGSIELETNISNLMLLCDECHNRIDKVQRNEHSVEFLRQIKREHEERILFLTGLKKENKTHVINYGANIGCNSSLHNNNDIIQSLLNERFYPSSDKFIYLGLKNAEIKDHEPEYWTFQEKQLISSFKTNVYPLSEEESSVPFSVFALAPQPLLVKLGVLFSDIQNVILYQKHREPNTWAWLDEVSKNDFRIRRPKDNSQKPVLIFSLSSKAISKRVRKLYEGKKYSIWELTVSEPGNDMLKSKKQLQNFRVKVRKLLDEINTSSLEKEIQVYMAMPVSCAIELGRVWMPKADKEMLLYDFNRTVNKEIPTITIK